MTRLQKSQQGFSAVETVLVVVILAAIVGVGYYVWHQGQSSTTLSDNGNSSKTTKAPAGTSASIDQLTTQDAQTETAADNAADGQTSQNATSANTALTNVGGAYNESNL